MMPYVTELNLTALCFAVSLLSFLLALNKDRRTVSFAFLELLGLGILICLFESVLGLSTNASMAHPPGLSFLTPLCQIVEILETAEAIFFLRYVLRMIGDEKRTARCARIGKIYFLLYLAAQLVNCFSPVIIRVDADGTRSTGILFIPLVMVIPFLFSFAAVLLYLTKTNAKPGRKAAVCCALLLVLAGAVLQRANPFLMSAGFAVVIGDFILYFVFETPPYQQLAQRIKELENAAAQAEAAREEAFAEDKAMNDFLANMSHEIRTPLTAILGYDEVILAEAPEEDVREYARDIQNAGHTLLYIVNDILDFSKIESGETTLTGAPYLLGDVLDNIDNMVRKRAQDKGLEYHQRVDLSTPMELNGDSVRINQILINLLNNAVKYTKQGYVELSLSHEKKEAEDNQVTLVFAVTDTGIGIREEDREKLFRTFARVDHLTNRGIEGTGLGLPITARLLALMNGTIDVTSSYGVGSTFTVRIPQEMTGEKTLASYSSHASSESGRDGNLLMPGAHMLVVDDNETNRTVVAELLKYTLIKVDTAQGGAEALNLVKENAYDLILLDQMMPHMSGTETLSYMKAMRNNASKHAPVIAFTADAIAGTREKLINQGFDDYLAKPVTLADLTNMLRKFLPEEKCLTKGKEGYEAACKTRDAMFDEQEKSAEQETLEALRGIDLTAALAVCGSKEVLLAAVRDFYLTIEQQATLIEQYLRDGDIANYTIKVHALKSASRFIGARKLSADAAYLEECGGHGDMERIRERTPLLLKDYRAYKENLAAIDPDARDKAERDAREEISPEDLEEAYAEIRAFAEHFDFDGADAVIEALQEYRIGEAEKKRFEKVRLLVTEVNRTALLEELAD